MRERQRQASLGNVHFKGHRHTSEAKEKIRRAALGNKKMRGRKHTPETKEKLRQARLRQRFPSEMTSIEQVLHGEFKKRRLKFEMHKSMFGRFQPDFVFAGVRLIVQADGHYWHKLARKRSDDARFNQLAHEAGWTVWRFAESEIQQHSAACGRAVARFVRSH